MSRAPRLSNPYEDLWVCHLGQVPYRRALAAQELVRSRRQRGELPDTLLLLEHPPVYTRGRRSGEGEIGAAGGALRGIEIVETDRGGRVTYHGPGQLVGYPIMVVEDVRRYVRTMEDAIVRALAEEGVAARARPEDGPDYTGVWVGPRKIASIGVHVQLGVSTHGFAVNVANDLEPFTWIVPCGLSDVTMTSLALEREQPAGPGGPCDQELRCFRRRMALSFAATHGRRQRLVSAGTLGIGAVLAGEVAATDREQVPA